MDSSRGKLLLVLLLGLAFGFLSPREAYGQKVKVGEPAPDFTVPSLDGHSSIRLSDFRGHRVLVFTWASW